MLLCSQGEVQKVISEQTSGTTGAGKRVFYTEGDCEHTIELFMAGLGEFIYPGSITMVAMPFSGPFGLGELIAEAIRRLGAKPLSTGTGRTYGELNRILEEEQPGIWRCLSENCHESNRRNSSNTTLAALWFQRDGAWRCHLLHGA